MTVAGIVAPVARQRWLAWVLVGLEAALATFVAAVPWLRAFQLAGAAGVLVAASVAPVVIAVAVARWWRQPALVSYGCSLVGLILLLVIGVSHDPGAILRGAGQGPSHLLTDTLPLTTPRSLFVAPVLVTWVAGAATAEILARSARTALALGVAVLAYLGAYAASSGAPGHDVATGAVLLAVLAALAITRREVAERARPTAGAVDEPSGRAAQTLVGGSAFVLVVALLAWLVVPALPGLGAREASLARVPPTASASAVSPVDAVAALRDDDPKGAPETMFDVDTSGPSTGYLALAALDLYDGDSWSFDQTFEPTGGRVAAPPTGFPAPSGPRVRQDYTVVRSLGPSLPFVPYVDRPVEVAGRTLDVDPTTGMVVPLGPVPVGARYTITSQAPLDTLAQIPASTAVSDAGAPVDSQLPTGADTDLTSTLQYLATLTGQRPAPTVAFLQAVLTSLVRTDKRIDPVALVASAKTPPPTRGGTSLAEVVNATTVTREATPEQFATLFVVVARALGVPARLVTGFRITAGETGGVGSGSHQVTNREAWTWAEIPVDGFGWVVADPTPAAVATGVTTPSATGAATTATTVPPPQANAVPGNGNGTHALAPPTHVRLPHRVRHSAVPLVTGLVLLALLALIGAAFGAAAGWRALRRRRRRRGGPEAQVLGAWLEVLDGLSRGGVAPERSATTTEVADLAGRSYGPELVDPVRLVGELADRAMCSTRSSIEAGAADAAWQAARRVDQQIQRQLPSSQRLRASLLVGGPALRRGTRPSRSRPARRALARPPGSSGSRSPR